MSPEGRRSGKRLTFERRILWLALAAGLPGGLIAMVLLWTGEYSLKVRYTATLFVFLIWIGIAFHLRSRVVWPLQTLSNLLAALREGDFSIRASGARRGDAMGEVMLETNELTDMLREQRLDAMEATTLLRKTMAEIDVAVYAFDTHGKLRLVNRAGEKLLARPAERLAGLTAGELGLAELIDGDGPRLVDRTFPGGAGRWEIRRASFRQGGLPLKMLVITDLSRALRQEERQAWQRLMRVLGHELNNSLTPIRSITESLRSLVTRQPRPGDWEEDLRRGLDVIGARAEALSRFMGAYTRLARLPEPERSPVGIGPLVRRVVGLETRLKVSLAQGPATTLNADADQIEQLLINLLRNAVDAALQTGGGVEIGWAADESMVDVWIRDEGPGLPETMNLFVPFFTTKPGGSGIGLVLSRQIAEAHGGTLTLMNRETGTGCEALLRLPL